VIGSVSVGTAPVGVTVSADGGLVFVTNSNRFAGSQRGEAVSVIDSRRIRDGAAAVVGSIPAGAFPRVLQVTGGGRSLLISNFGSSTIAVIDLTRLVSKPR
jgi:DNA-binding beta-propeller fold protein YncE